MASRAPIPGQKCTIFIPGQQISFANIVLSPQHLLTWSFLNQGSNLDKIFGLVDTLPELNVPGSLHTEGTTREQSLEASGSLWSLEVKAPTRREHSGGSLSQCPLSSKGASDSRLEHRLYLVLTGSGDTSGAWRAGRPRPSCTGLSPADEKICHCRRREHSSEGTNLHGRRMRIWLHR